MIYLFNNQDKLIDIVTEEELIDWTYTVAINAFDESEFELPIDNRLAVLKEAVYFGFVGYKGEFKVFRITDKELKEERIIKGIDRAESDLRTVSIIKDKRPQNVTADQALQVALEGTGYEVGRVEGLPLLNKVNFYYISPREALVKIIETWSCEFRVRYTFVDNQIVGRYIDLFKKEGRVTGRQFYHGDDLLAIEYEESSDDVVTALIGRGKGEENTDEEGLSTGGYGRRIEFTDVVWSKSAGKPTNKPAGQNYVTNEAAREQFGLYQNGQVKHRWGVFIDEQIEDKEVLLQRTWEELERLSIPITTYKANLVEIGTDVWKGDSVAIIRDDIGIAFEARIHKIVMDRLNNDQSTVELGDYTTLRERQANNNTRAFQELINERLSEHASSLQAFLIRLEEEKERKNTEFDEKFRTMRLELDNAIEGAKNEATKNQETFAQEIDDKLAKQKEEAKKLLASVEVPELDKLKQELAETSETAQANARLIGGDGTTSYNKNRLLGETERTIPYQTDYIEVRHNGEGFEVGKTYVISWSATCVTFGYRNLMVRFEVSPFIGSGQLVLVPHDAKYPTLDETVSSLTKTLYHVYYAQYHVTATFDWYQTKRQTFLVDDRTVDLHVSLVFKDRADGNVEHNYIGQWAESPDIILDGGAN